MMPSNRRLKAFSLLVVICILLTLYITASARQTRSSDFYTKTQDALAASRQHKDGILAGSEVATGEDDMVKHRLKAAADAAKVKAEEKAESYHGTEAKQQALKIAESLRDDKQDNSKDQVLPKSSKSSKSSSGRPELEDDEQSVAGRKIMKSSKQETLKPGKEITQGDDGDEKENTKHEESDAERKAHAELSEILKKSPMIIFSKTYCPYSKKAKHILLEKYKILPPPHVVELDIHPLGKELQAYLGPLTGRKTVPNILVQGKSMGGGDDMEALDQKGELIDTILRMGGKRMTVTKASSDAENAEVKKVKEKREVERKRKRRFQSS